MLGLLIMNSLVRGVIAAASCAGGDLVALRRAGVHADRHAVGQQRHVGIGHPVGRRNHAFIARIEQRGAGIETGLLGPGGDQDLAALIGQAVVALELGDDGVFQFRRAVDRGIARDPLANGLDARICDMRRRVEIRFAGRQSDDVFAFGFELGGPGGHGEGRGGLNLLNALGKGHGQGEFLC